MSDNKVYWTQRNGVKIDIDTMDIQHLRNTLKMIVRIVDNYDSAVKTKKIPSSKCQKCYYLKTVCNCNCNITKRFEDDAIDTMGPNDEFPIFKFN